MGDWIGLVFIGLLIVCGYIGLKMLSKPRRRTSEEFEKGATESASLIGVSVNALNGILNPEAAKGNAAVEEVQKGSYNKKNSEGKAIGDELKGEK